MSTDLHDRVARTYNSETGLIADKNRRVLHRQRQRWAGRPASLTVVDLGVGDGALLEALQRELTGDLGVPLSMTGLDISPAMLEQAGQRVPLRPVLSCAGEAALHLPAGTFDLVLAHFILAYVDRRQVLQQARRLLSRQGVLSVATSTNEGAAPLKAQIESHFRSSLNPLRRMIAWATDRAFGLSSVPDRAEDLVADAQACGLRILSRETLRQTIVFSSAAEAYRFAIEDGWCVNVMTVPGLPVSVGQSLVRSGLGLFRYPFVFTQVIEMMEFCRDDGGARAGPCEDGGRVSVRASARVSACAPESPWLKSG